MRGGFSLHHKTQQTTSTRKEDGHENQVQGQGRPGWQHWWRQRLRLTRGGFSLRHKTDHHILGTFAVGVQPIGIAFDGGNIWVANSGRENVSKL